MKLTPETEARIRLGEKLLCICGRVLKVGATGRFANIVDCENRCVSFDSEPRLFADERFKGRD